MKRKSTPTKPKAINKKAESRDIKKRKKKKQISTSTSRPKTKPKSRR